METRNQQHPRHAYIDPQGVIVIRYLRMERNNVLKTAYEYHEYLDALSEFATGCPEIDLKTAFAQAFDCANEGISQIGVDAEKCRISGRPMHRDRLEFAREKIKKCLQKGCGIPNREQETRNPRD